MGTLPSITGQTAARDSRSPYDSYIQPTLGHGLRIWWALYWRTSVIGVLLVLAVGDVAEILSRNGLLTSGARTAIVTASAYVLTFVAAYFVMHYVVRKRFRGFRVILSPAAAAGVGPELEPTRRRTTRIWWTYTWRSLIYLVLLSIAANIPLGAFLFAVGAISVKWVPVARFVVSMVLNGAVGLFVIYSNILDEDIAGFRVGLAPATDGSPFAAGSSTRS